MGVAHADTQGRRCWRCSLLPLAACSPYADAERDVAAGGRGLAKLNPAPKQAYELVLTLKDAPGPFAVVEGVAQYDVSNYADCGRIVPATGTASRITSQEPVNCTRSARTSTAVRSTSTACRTRTTTGVASAIGR
jgi:hypothetical protein